MKLVVNKCYGGFGLSAEAVICLIDMGSDLVRKMTISDYTGGRGLRDYKLKKVGDRFQVNEDLGSSVYDMELKNIWVEDSRDYENRGHKDLVAVVEKLGDKASNRLANLQIVEIPDDIEWEIDDYDGVETVEEKHQSW